MKHSKQKLQGVAVSAAESERGREYLLSSELKLSAVLTKCTKETERFSSGSDTKSSFADLAEGKLSTCSTKPSKVKLLGPPS